jgi:hypothetical protein
MKKSTRVRGVIDDFGELGEDIGAFIKRNYGLIIKTAKKKFGPNFCVPTILSDAAAAWFVMKDQHNKSKSAKDTSSYFWHLHRQMDITYGTGIAVDQQYASASRLSEDSGLPTGDDFVLDQASHEMYGRGDDESGLGHEEQLYYGIDEAGDFESSTPDGNGNGNGSGKNGHGEFMEYVPKYVICMESFADIKCGADLSMLMKALSDDNGRNNRERYENLIATRRSLPALSDRLRKNLIFAAHKAGYYLYIAVCLNGACNNVLVAAQSQEEAAKYLSRYGNLMEIRRLETSPAELTS